MANFKIYKEISAIPTPYKPNTIYIIRVGIGIDFYMSDSTGTNVYGLNLSTLLAKLTGGNLFSGDQTVTGAVSTQETYGTDTAPTFNRADWTLTSGWDSTNAGDTVLDKNAAGTTTATAIGGIAPISGTQYKITFTVGDSISGGAFVGNVTPSIGGTSYASITAKGTYTYYFHAVATTKLVFTPSTTGARFSISGLSILPVLNTADIIAGSDFKIGSRIVNKLGQVIMYWYPNLSTYFANASTFNSTLTVNSGLTVTSSCTFTRTYNYNNPQQGVRAACTTSATAALPSQVSTTTEMYGSNWDTSSKNQYWNMYVDNIYNASVGRSRFKFNYLYNSTTAALAIEQMGIDSNGTVSIMGNAVSTTETMTNGALTSGTSWAVTGDFALTSNAATATYSTGSGTLTQVQANLATTAIGGVWYAFNYVVSAVNSTHYMYIGTEFAAERVYLNTTTAGTYTVKFKSATTPTDFKIYYVGTAGTVTIDTFSLKRCDAGNLEVANNITHYGNHIFPKESGKGILVDVAAPTFGWRDLLGLMYPDVSGANRPSLAAFRGGNVRQFAYSAGDLIDVAFHLPHDYLPGSDIYFHVHWMHNGTAISGNIVFTFYHSYAKGHNQANYTAEKNVTLTYATTNIATTPQYRHRIEEVQLSSNGGSATLLDSTTLEPDGVISGQLVMTTIPTITGGSPNEPFIAYVDLHYQSTGLPTKQKAPNFYV